MPGLPKNPTPPPRRPAARRVKKRPLLTRRWFRYLLLATGVATIAGATFFGIAYVQFARMIEAQLHGERIRTLPRVYARPVELRRGQMVAEADVIGRLNDLGYSQRAKAEKPGEFTIERNAIRIMPRSGPAAGKPVRVAFTTPPPKAVNTRVAIQTLEVGGAASDDVRLDSPLLTALMASGAREKRRHVPLTAIPKHMQQAVLAIEDQRFYSHPGVNPIRFVGAAVMNVMGRRVSGASTITEQLARMFFFEDEFNAEIQSGTRGRSWGSRFRRVQQAFMSIVLERRASKDEILEMYLNDVYLGQRGSFGINGVAEASRIFFGKDVANLTIGEAALIAGTINSPINRSPFTQPKRATDRRNVVVAAMLREQYITAEQAEKATREPLHLVARAVDNEAPYFVDLVAEQVNTSFPAVMTQEGNVDVYTTLDINLQRAALEAVQKGMANVDQLLSGRRRKRPQPPQAALIAIDPKTGEILAMVGGRSYNQSQFNRVIQAHRQPGSTVKPFVYLAAFEDAYENGRTDLTPASLTRDEPETFTFDDQVWEPRNYDDYDGEITWRRALAMSRNLGTIHVGEQVGWDRIAGLWKRIGVGAAPQPYPSITLGVFELTPLEVATAYTIFTNDGSVRPLRAIDRIDAGGKVVSPAAAKPKNVTRPDTTFLVTNMMRSVLNEGTGAAARGNGFTADAAGKSGTTNDLRDAWFVGFTPDLLTVTWVGYDDNQPLGLSGSQAALPIWTEFMKAATAGRPNRSFDVPDGISFVDIDRDTGKLATPYCPRTFGEAFISGTEPTELCPLHHW